MLRANIKRVEFLEMKSSENTEVRIVYSRGGFESNVGHHVRSKMEAAVCEWLMQHAVAHRHGSEMFTVRVGASGTPTAYVPDIILHDKDDHGRTVLIEPFDASIPRIGGTRIIAAFRKEMRREYYVIIIAKKQQMKKVLGEAYDVLLDYGKLDDLEEMLPHPAR